MFATLNIKKNFKIETISFFSRKPDFEWPMTKLLLELGSDVNFELHWDSDFHPGFPVFRGTTLDLAQEMKVRKFDSIFAALKISSVRSLVLKLKTKTY